MNLFENAPGRRRGAMLLACALVLAPSMSWAQDARDDGSEAPASAARSLKSGTFAAWSVAARNDGQKGFAHVTGGYDAAKNGPAFESVVEAQVLGRLSLRAGASYVGPRGEVRPVFGGRVDALRQERHGIDLAIAAGYEPHGFNTVPAAGALVAVGRSVGAVNLLGNLGYGIGLEEGERYGDARFAALYRVAPRLRVGLDSRFRMDLERDGDEPVSEPDWELMAGPLASVTAGRFVLSGGVGLSALRMRLESKTNAGAVAYAGVGAVF
jgi:hypothetical protein